ncbi:unnamed protein product (macronuclear) [Paramecium tetraurelia]|uniref:Uncharacterized protein n=1 Tax=Paramecium tetraurelia TaxID=5888 RepID=A0DTF3_PARTE|nr:uncharacterized protein GSPATT00020001001 [Paramecium tetraurelia]CAK86320.1 unnamed protein product [Paramecium tetraurelia]|eukprot:XP_001453717.1 hypothetical protein (macronuclear) [Paramecium tetraurelia strain d4-2]
MMEMSDSDDEQQPEQKNEETQTQESNQTIQQQNDQSNQNQKHKKKKEKNSNEKQLNTLKKIKMMISNFLVRFKQNQLNNNTNNNQYNFKNHKKMDLWQLISRDQTTIKNCGQQKKGHKNVKQSYLTYNPDVNIQLADKFNVKFGNLNDQGLQIFFLVASQQYERLQQEYTIVEGFYDPQAIFNFLQMNPSHCEAQFDVSEYYRLKGDYIQAYEPPERLLYIYESSLGYGLNKFFEDASINLEIEDKFTAKYFLWN